MAAPLSYKKIVERLANTLSIQLGNIEEEADKDKIQQRISTAKHRMGIEGKLSYEWIRQDNGLWNLSIVLMPTPKKSHLAATIVDEGI